MKRFFSVFVSLILVLTLVPFNTKAAMAAEASQITRAQAEQRALAMVNLKWTYSVSRNSSLSPTGLSLVTQPDQLKNVTTGEMQGIPYNWGGLDGLDTNSMNAQWTNFLDAVNKGAYTGNVNTEAGYGYISGTAGIDCSGFVQATYNIHDSKLSTSTMFNKYFTKIDMKDIKHMDILNKPYDHVVIFDRWGTLNGVYGAFTYESTPDATYGGIQGTKRYFLSMEEINKGYIPGRYVNILEDNAVRPGTYAKVANVQSFANFRLEPSASSTLIGTIPKDTVLYLISGSSGWYQVNYNGRVGFIYGNLLSPIESGKYVTVYSVYQLNIRTSPSTSAQIIGTISKNQYAEVLGYSSDGNWIRIRVNGIEGWSSKAYLSYIY